MTDKTSEEIVEEAGSGLNDSAADQESYDPGAEVADATSTFRDFESKVMEAEKAGKEPDEEPAEEKAEAAEKAEDTGDSDGTEPGKEPAKAEGDTPKPGKSSYKERLGQLTKQKHEANAEVERLRAENEALRAAKSGESAKPEKKGVDNEEPNPDDFEYGIVDPKYVAALASHMADQRVAAALKSRDENVRLSEAERQAAERSQKYEERAAAVAEKHEDFFEKVVEGAEANKWALSNHLGPLLEESEHGPEAAYFLASNPEKSREIAKMHPLQQAKWLGEFEARQGQPTSEGSGKTPKTTKAPAPITQTRGSSGAFKVDPNTTDFKAFESAYSKEMSP